jgi:hypothetical protein
VEEVAVPQQLVKTRHHLAVKVPLKVELVWLRLLLEAL